MFETSSRASTPYGRRQESHVCKVCKRGSSPKNNQIVFCDECNTPYHQLCHVPPIDRLVIDVPDAQWYCNDCQLKRRERPLETGLSGENLSLDVKMTYLSSLSKAQLIELIQFAETIDPKLPIYSPNTLAIALKMQLENDKKEHHTNQSKVNYEDLLVDAINAKSTGRGVEISEIWQWISKESGPSNKLDSTSLQSATRAFQRALRRGRILKSGSLYFANTNYQPPSELSLSQYLSSSDEAMFSEATMIIPPPADEDDYYTYDENEEVFSHKVYIRSH